MRDDHHIYLRQLDPEADGSLAKIASLVRPGSKVLDIGAGPGALGHYLRGEKECTVDGVDCSAVAAGLAAGAYRNYHVADVEQVVLETLFPAERYDYIVCADVLEHLRAPGRLVEQFPTLLKPEGRILFSLPNVSYAGVIGELLSGDFRYRPEGLLDNTHLRFFTRTSLLRFLRDHGLHVVSLDTVSLDPNLSEFSNTLKTYSPTSLAQLLAPQDACTYQFIVEASPLEEFADDGKEPFSTGLISPSSAKGFPCQLYWRRAGEDFDEDSSVVAMGMFEEETQTVHLAIPPLEDIEVLRLDPADRPGYLHIQAIRLYGKGNMLLWQWDGRSISLEEGGTSQIQFADRKNELGVTALLCGDDPQIFLPVPQLALASLQEGGDLELELSWPASSDYLLLARKINTLEEASSSHIRALEKEVAQRHNRILDLEAVLAQEVEIREDRIASLYREVEIREDRVSNLENEKAIHQELEGSLRREISVRERRIAELEVAQSTLLNSRTWRLTEPLRRAGQLVRRMRHLVKWSRLHRLELRPIHHLELANGGYSSTGNDPQFLLGFARPVRPGWAVFSYSVLNATPLLSPRLYIDDGLGIREEASIALPPTADGEGRKILLVPGGVRALRFDPLNSPGYFELKDFALCELGTLQVALMAIRHQLQSDGFWRGVFAIMKLLGRRGLKGGREQLLTDLQNGRTLKGSFNEPLREKRIRPKVDKVDVVIPVYRGLEETRDCLESVLATSCETEHEVVVINDCSPEPALTAYLEERARRGGFTLLQNEENLGFVQTVNRGMSLHPNRDVVLLNSDTAVANDWLDRLYRCAYANPKIGTVTPFSNNATICSYPRFCEDNGLPDGEPPVSLDTAFAEANPGAFVEIPTAVGFCMYIRRDCLNDVGIFDAETFGKGYGEENDFCMRARKIGWRHVQAADTFVFHAGGVSFAESGNPLRQYATEAIRRLHPTYESLVRAFVAVDPAAQYRHAASVRRFARSGKPSLLFVCHHLGGGTEKHIRDLHERLKERVRILALRPAENGQVLLESLDPADGFSLRLESGRQVAELGKILAACGVYRVHIHHVLGHNLGDLRRLLTDIALPFDFTVHDYYAMCPQVSLSNQSGIYCEEPDLDGCRNCLAARSLPNWVDIEVWRARHSWLVWDADRVIAPSRDVACRMERYFPDREIIVALHPGPPKAGSWPSVSTPRLSEDEPFRILVLGVLTPHKGIDWLEGCVEAAAKNHLPLQFHHLGSSIRQLRPFPSEFLRYHGSYEDSELLVRIEEIKPHLIWFPSQVPETFSYTLSAAFQAGLPVVCPELGAFPERLRGRPWSWSIPHTFAPAETANFFCSLRENHFLPHVSPEHSEGDWKIPSIFYEKNYLQPPFPSIEGGLYDLRREGGTAILAIVPTHPDGGPDPCAYIRLLQPFRHRDIAARFRLHLVTEERALQYRADILVIQRTAVADPGIARRLLAHCLKTGMKTVFEIDDALFHLPENHPEFEHYRCATAAARLIAEGADAVSVSTSGLQRKLKAANTNTTVIPNALDESLWGLDAAVSPANQDDAEIGILYMGTLTHGDDLALVQEAIEALRNDYGRAIRFDVIGVVAGGSGEWFNAIPVPPPIAANYPEFVRWLRRQNRWQIGIAPLADSDFNRCKSFIKYLDYAALGLAGVFSDIEPYRDAIREDETGLLVKNESQAWYQALKRLIEDRDLRQRIRGGARADLLASHTLAAHGGKRIRFWEEVSKLPGPVQGDQEVEEMLRQRM